MGGTKRWRLAYQGNVRQRREGLLGSSKHKQEIYTTNIKKSLAEPSPITKLPDRGIKKRKRENSKGYEKNRTKRRLERRKGKKKDRVDYNSPLAA